MFYRVYIVLVFILLFAVSVLSQDELEDPTPTMALSALHYQSEVRLRWAPLNDSLFKNALQHGFKLERAVVAINGTPQSESEYNNSMTVLNSTLVPTTNWDTVNAPSSLQDIADELVNNTTSQNLDLDTATVFDVASQNKKKATHRSLVSLVASRNWNIAKALGWAYSDSNIQSGYEYEYRLSVYDSSGILATWHTFIEIDQSESLATPSKPIAVPGDSSVLIKVRYKELKDEYFGFYIEKSTDGGSTYNKIKDYPYMFSSQRSEDKNWFKVADTLASNSKKYIYRIAGASPFGIEGPYSDTVHVKGKASPIKERPIITGVNEVNEQAVISWDFPTTEENKIQGFVIQRGVSRKGPFDLLTQELLSPSTRQYTDQNPKSSNYYFVRAIDTNNYVINSLPSLFQPADSTAPSAPIGLNGSIDKNGQVELSWKEPSALDVDEYRVFAANDPNGNFIEITKGGIQDTTFSYQINPNLINKKWYVKVSAQDNRDNESQKSNVLQLDRPDNVPPPSPVLKTAEPAPVGVGLSWNTGGSEDIETIQLQRKKVGKRSWENILDVTSDSSDTYTVPDNVWESQSGATYNHVDTTVDKGEVYSYRLVSYDESGNGSYSMTLTVTAYDSGLRGSIYNLQGTSKEFTTNPSSQFVSAETKKNVVIAWEYTQADKVHNFVIYRKRPGYPFVAYDSYLVYDKRPNPANTTYSQQVLSAPGGNPNGEFKYVDKHVKPGKTYEYKILAKHIDGGFSEFSGVLQVAVNN